MPVSEVIFAIVSIPTFYMMASCIGQKDTGSAIFYFVVLVLEILGFISSPDL